MNNRSNTLLNIQQLITAEQTAHILGISPGSLTVWRSTGRYDLPFVKVGSKVMYNPADVQAFIERRTRAHTD